MQWDTVSKFPWEGKNSMADRSETHARVGLVTACLLVPPLMLCALAACAGFYPFGEQSFLSSDLAQQYVDLYTWLWGVLHGQRNLLYSWGISLGTSMWANFSYYLSSPLNLLLLLFPEDKITLFVFVTDALKLSLVQLALCWYVRRRFGIARPWAFLLALGFCLSTWTVSMLRNPLWLDALYLMPLAMYGCWRYVREGRWGFLLAVLSIDIMVCWYMAYMSIVFLCLYALWEAYIAHADDHSLGLRWFAGRALGFVLVLAGSLLLSAWTFLPTVIQMLGTENTGGSVVSPRLRYLVAGLYPGTLLVDVTPQLFFGSLVLMLAGAFVFNRRIALGRRTATLALMLLLAASCVVTELGLVFTGFRLPDGFYCRYSWLFGLMATCAAAAEVKSLADGEAPHEGIAISLAIESLGVVALWVLGVFPSRSWAVAAEATLVALAVLVHLTFSARGVRRQALWIGAAGVIVCAELLASGHQSWGMVYTDKLTQRGNDNYVAVATSQQEALREHDSGAYRMDKTFQRWGNSFNEGLVQGYAGLSGYTSVNNARLFGLLDTLGVTGTPSHYLTRYLCPVPTTDSLLGIRYVFTGRAPTGYEDTGLVSDNMGYGIYRNPEALSLGYGVSSGLSGLTLDSGADRDPFANQNALISAMLGHEVSVWKPVDVTARETGKPDRLHWTVTSGADAQVYAYITNNPSSQQVTCSILDGAETFAEYDFSRHGIFPLAGGTQEVYVLAKGTAPGVRLAAYELDEAAYQDAMSELAQHQLQVTNFSDGHLAGSYQADDDGTLLTTVPYDEGWRVTVNGKAVGYEAMVEGGLIAIPVRAGRNDIEMTFVPRGLPAGCAVTAASCTGLLARVVVRRRRRRGRQG